MFGATRVRSRMAGRERNVQRCETVMLLMISGGGRAFVWSVVWVCTLVSMSVCSCSRSCTCCTLIHVVLVFCIRALVLRIRVVFAIVSIRVVFAIVFIRVVFVNVLRIRVVFVIVCVQKREKGGTKGPFAIF